MPRHGTSLLTILCMVFALSAAYQYDCQAGNIQNDDFLPAPLLQSVLKINKAPAADRNNQVNPTAITSHSLAKRREVRKDRQKPVLQQQLTPIHSLIASPPLAQPARFQSSDNRDAGTGFGFGSNFGFGLEQAFLQERQRRLQHQETRRLRTHLRRLAESGKALNAPAGTLDRVRQIENKISANRHDRNPAATSSMGQVDSGAVYFSNGVKSGQVSSLKSASNGLIKFGPDQLAGTTSGSGR